MRGRIVRRPEKKWEERYKWTRRRKKMIMRRVLRRGGKRIEGWKNKREADMEDGSGKRQE